MAGCFLLAFKFAFEFAGLQAVSLPCPGARDAPSIFGLLRLRVLRRAPPSEPVHGFEEELTTLPGRYAPPQGRLLLAWEGEQAAGCVALRPLDAAVCEMKRLFVRPAYRGRGWGRGLATRILHEATALGYTVMRLDTLDTLDPAMRLYRELGFQRRAPYYANPLSGVVYWERALSSK